MLLKTHCWFRFIEHHLIYVRSVHTRFMDINIRLVLASIPLCVCCKLWSFSWFWAHHNNILFITLFFHKNPKISKWMCARTKLVKCFFSSSKSEYNNHYADRWLNVCFFLFVRFTFFSIWNNINTICKWQEQWRSSRNV